MDNCTNCGGGVSSNCGSTIPSTCVLLSKTFSYDCETDSSCYKTLEDVLRYWKPIICDAKHALDLSSLDRTCYTTSSNTGLTLSILLQELINNDCANTTAISVLATALSTYIPDYKLISTVNFRCTWSDPCVDDKPLTLQTALQRIIDKICDINSRLATLEYTFNALPWSYPIDYNLYPCIVHNTGKSDLDNLFYAVQNICTTYGTSGMSTALAYVGASSLAQAISTIWSSILTLQSSGGGGGGGGSTVGFSSDFTITSNLYFINPITIKNIIDSAYVRAQFTAGTNITIDPLTGVISSNPPAVGLTTTTNAATLVGSSLEVRQKREIFYESSLAGTVPGNDGSVAYTAVTVTTTTDLFFTQLPANVSAGANGSVILVDSYVAGVSKRMIPGLHYTIMAGRVGITLVTGVVAGQIIDVTYF